MSLDGVLADRSLLNGSTESLELLDEPLGHVLDVFHIAPGKRPGSTTAAYSSPEVSGHAASSAPTLRGKVLAGDREVRYVRRDSDGLSEPVDKVVLVVVDKLEELGVGSHIASEGVSDIEQVGRVWGR